MSKITLQYAELVELTKLYLLREHPKTYCQTTLENRDFFRKWTPPKLATPKEALVPPQQPIPQESIKQDIILPKPNLKPKPQNNIARQPIIKKPEETQEDKKNIILELPTPANSDLAEWKQFFSSHFPNFPLNDTIPFDSEAKRLKVGCKTISSFAPVLLLSNETDPTSQTFLQNLSNAITLHVAPCQIVFINNEINFGDIWRSQIIRLILSTKSLLEKIPELKTHHRMDINSKQFLKNIHFIEFLDPQTYLQNPSLKHELWKAIRHEWSQIGLHSETD